MRLSIGSHKNLFRNFFFNFLIILEGIIILCLLPFNVFAHPASSVQLTYENGVLHISMIHVTNNIREHHIRKIVVWKNDAEVATIILVTQTSPNDVQKDVPFDAKGGDVISVKAYCKEGGIAEGTLTIPKPPPPEKKPFKWGKS